ncbi:meprin A subunit alpha [Patagioenas fasciata monilis]|uniref:Metalloendopeptidase n=1 Tax=Patagioenas fasciata monilis TaxID=372326 RepID=A0A1V4JPJ3_PATFA|nr:meprin A subunit alpha [Patagioenas fasciata monilis]
MLGAVNDVDGRQLRKNIPEINSGFAYAFDKANDSFIDDLNAPSDYESVLQYGPYSFNINSNVPYITTKIPECNEIIEQKLDFSRIDLLMLICMYNCTADADAGEIFKDIPEINLAAGLDLFQGDIMLPKNQRNALRNETYRWKFPVPYILSDNLDLNAKAVILQAFELFRLKSCIDFKPYEGESSYIFFKKESGCWSMVGDLKTGQDLSIGTGCDYTAIVEHEILHALGFYHEQSRSDRDDYVNIWWDEIIAGREHNFEKYDDDFITDLNTPYDYESLMHYAPFSFNKNESIPTITAKIPVFDSIIGQRLDFSAIDLERLNRMYNCTSTHTFLDQCSFELDNICGMIQGAIDDLDWVHQLSSADGEEDHTLSGRCRDAGHFMYFSTSSGQADEVAVLESRILYPKRTQQCLQFFYKITGSLSDKLIIWLKEDDGTGNIRKMRRIQTFQADNDYNWKIAHVTLNAQKKFRYLFQGLKADPSSSSGGIAIDDVTLTETPCPTAVWVVRNFSQILESGTTDVIQSPRFYSPEGYGFGVSLYPHSVTSGYSRIAFHLCSGENDGVLEWPALNRQATLTVLDQDPDVLQRMSSIRSFTTSTDQISSGANGTLIWEKPSVVGTFDASCNCYRSANLGWNSFISHSQLRRRSFLKNDDLIIFAEFNDVIHLNYTEVPVESEQPAFMQDLILERQKRAALDMEPIQDQLPYLRDPCEPNPCQNDGVCVNVKGRASCRCPSGQAFFFTGERCQSMQVHGNILGITVGGIAGTIVLTIALISVMARR